MTTYVQPMAEKFNMQRAKKQRWQKVVTAMAAVVVFCTTYALIIPAITWERTLICEQPEHEHTDACYEVIEIAAETKLSCELEEHVHTEDCLGEVQVLVCGEVECEEHHHEESCYTEETYLVCGETECEAHHHDKGCYTEETYLACTSDDPEHEHDDSCYATRAVLSCGLSETEGHTHADSCYATRSVLSCGKEEAEGHTHDESCYATEIGHICGLEEHTHDENCYTEVPAHTEEKLVCGLEEHAHTDGCFDAPPAPEDEGYYCGHLAHIHDESCYFEDGTLKCTLEEHEHTLACESDPNADREREKDWVASFDDAKLGDNWAENVIAIAETQLGYKESTKNFIVTETGKPMGYTRYGAWYGGEYGDWCAMFCSFCLHYAGVDTELMPIEESCHRWVEALQDEECDLYRPAEDYTPLPGDLVFFDWDEFDPEDEEAVAARSADHIGFVYEVIEATEETPAMLRTIEGNSGNAVRVNEYELDDIRILGYGELPENPDEEEKTTITAQASDGAEVVITGVLPEGAEAQIEAVTLSADELIAYFGEAKAAAMKSFVAYDIKIMVDGEEWQPDETVSVVVKEPGITVEEGENLGVAHVNSQTEAVSNVSAVVDESGEVSFEADGFSVYIFYTFTVDFHFGETTFSINGRSEILLSELFAELGIEFDAADAVNVTFSDETLLAVEQVENDWLLTSLEAFDTNETLTIEFADGEVLIIDVTDAQGTAIGSANAFTTNLKNGGTYYLSADFSVGSTVTITKNTTLDLNGHRLTVTANPLFNVTGGTLTIIDSGSQTVTSSIRTDRNKYANLASYSDNTLTYYVTETQVVRDTGATEETLVRYRVTGGGMIVGSGNGRAITMSGGTLNLNGGYICNFNAGNGNKGGAISATGGTLNLDGAVIAANKAASGGGIYVTGSNTVLNIKSGCIAGNEAYYTGTPNSERYGGAGVFMAGHCTVNVTGGYITNNNCSNYTNRTYCNGGGAFIVWSSTLNISGGYLTGNAGPSGGAIITVRITHDEFDASQYAEGGKIYMTGGFVTGNASHVKEGGGISLDGYGYMSLTGGYVTNNRCAVNKPDFGDWGGGGIFVSDHHALLYVENVLVTENHAGGFGGGIAGCSTGRLNIATGNVCADYNNTAEGTSVSNSYKSEDHFYAKDSPVFMANGYQDYYCALSSQVSGGMLGGGTAMWTGSLDGAPIVSVSRDDLLQAASVLGLTAHPSDEDIANAKAAAKVYITGNDSPTHGGGILTNGYMAIGPKTVESYCRLELNATKKLWSANGTTTSLGNRVFTFVVEDENGIVVSTGTNNSSGAITFDRRIPFTDEGTFTYYAHELIPDGDTVIPDTTTFKIDVTIYKETTRITQSDTETFERNVYKFHNVKITDLSSNKVVYNADPGDDETHAVELDPTGGMNFNNTDASPTSLKVKKVWVGENKLSYIDVQLLRDGRNSGNPVRLNNANDWTYEWTNLDSRYTYTVKEISVDGFAVSYDTEYVKGDGSGSGEAYFVPATSLQAGEKYIITNYDGGRIMTANGSIGKVNKPSGTSLSGYKASLINSDCILTAERGSNGVLLKTASGQYLRSSSSSNGGLNVNDSGHSYVLTNGSIKRSDQYRYISYSDSAFRQATDVPSENEVVHLFRLDGGGGSGYQKVVTITNTEVQQAKYTLELTKYGELPSGSTTLLPGAEFQLLDSNGDPLHLTRTGSGAYKVDASGELTEGTVNSSGKLYIREIPQGTYTLHETRAPDGFGLVHDQTLTFGATTPNQKLAIELTDPEEQYELPETGGIGTNIIYTLGATLTAGALMYGCTVRRKRERRAD